MPKIQKITKKLIENILDEARKIERKRAMHCFHQGDWEHVHRMLNALTTGSYAQPHRHNDKYKSESFAILKGNLAVLVFNDKGVIDFVSSAILEEGGETLGIDIPPGVWHTIVAKEDSVIFEIKGQPDEGYSKESDKEFAPWAPVEGSEEADKYLAWLKNKINESNSAFN